MPATQRSNTFNAEFYPIAVFMVIMLLVASRPTWYLPTVVNNAKKTTARVLYVYGVVCAVSAIISAWWIYLICVHYRASMSSDKSGFGTSSYMAIVPLGAMLLVQLPLHFVYKATLRSDGARKAASALRVQDRG